MGNDLGGWVIENLRDKFCVPGQRERERERERNPKISHSLRETSPSDRKVNVVMIEFQIAHQGAVTDAGITSLNLNGAMLI